MSMDGINSLLLAMFLIGIRIRIGPDSIGSAGPDPARPKLFPPKNEKLRKISCLNSLNILCSGYK
jgi:hypothetical protein